MPTRSGVLAAGCLLCWASAALAQNVDDFQPQPAAARSARYAVEELALGTRIGFDSPAYREYKCAPSDQFDGFTWCQKTHREGGRRWSFETKYSMLHSRDGAIVYVNRYQRPAIVRPDEAESEIQNYSRRLGESPRVTRMPSRSGIHNAVLAAWGGIELEALDDHSLKSLAEGTSPKKGLLIDLIGNLTRSAQEDLPVYRIAGSAGFVWVAGSDHKGRGVLRFAAVDASAIQRGSLAVGRPSTSPNDQQPSRLQNELPSDTRADAGTVARLQTELSTVLKAKAGAELAAQKARIDAKIARNELELAIDDANAAKEEIDKLKANDGTSYISRIILINAFTTAFLLLILWALPKISGASPKYKLRGGKPRNASGVHKHDFEEGAVPLFATALTRSTAAETSIDQDGPVGMAPSAAQGNIREGECLPACERGIDEDERQYRLAFFFENRRFRLVVDEKGNSSQPSTVYFGIRDMA